MVVKFVQVMECVQPVSLDLILIMENAQFVLLLVKHVIVMEAVPPANNPSPPLLTPMDNASLALLLTVLVVLRVIKTNVKRVPPTMLRMLTLEYAN